MLFLCMFTPLILFLPLLSHTLFHPPSICVKPTPKFARKHVRLGLLDRNIALVLYNPTPSFYNIAIYAISFWHWIGIIFRIILFLLQYVLMQLDISTFDFYSFTPAQEGFDLFHRDRNSTFLPVNKSDRT